MPVLDAIAWTMDEIARGLARTLKQSPAAYCDLETAETEDILVDRVGAMLTVIEIGGINTMVLAEESEAMITSLVTGLGPSMDNIAHGMQLVFEFDPDARTGARQIEDMASRMKSGGRRAGLVGIEDLVDERIRAVQRYCAYERCTLVLRTGTGLLRPKDIKDERKRTRKEYKETRPMGSGTQNTQRTVAALVDAHRAYVASSEEQLTRQGISLRRLDVHQACAVIRSQMDPDFTDDSWQASLPGDPLPLTHNGRPKPEPSTFYWPPLHTQLLPRPLEILDLKTVVVGDRAYAPLLVERCPKEPQAFAALFASLSKARVPYRISFRIQGDGLRANNLRATIADSARFFGSQNARIADSFRQLQRYVRDHGGAAVSLAIDLVTWAPADDLGTLRQRANSLARSVQAWGGADVSEVSGQPADALTCSVAGLRSTTLANTTTLPLPEVLLMLPLTRPASPWATPNVLLRSMDGRLFPYSAYSSQQNAWVSLIVAPMGFGKSVLMNAINIGLCLDEGNQALPFISILDIGPSSSGLISLLQAHLPREQKHLALYKKLRMTPECAFNPMDTPLGSRYPLTNHMTYLTDLLSFLATPLNTQAPQDGIPGIANHVITEAYKNYADDKNPKRYSAGVDPMVDAQIAKHEVAIDSNTTWWELVDHFFAAGDVVAASRAQSYAVPTIPDCGALAKTSAVSDVYKGQATTGEPLGDYFWRAMREAAGEYMILTRPTKLDLGLARVVSLDLQDVAPRGEGKSARQSAVMYMAALWRLSADFLMSKDDLAEVNPHYREYHLGRIEDLAQSPKRIAADEFHRTQGLPTPRSMTRTIIREGRKHRVEVILCSQQAGDFDDDMVDLSTCQFVLGSGATGSKKIVERFGLTNSATWAIDHRLTGPGRGGAPLLASFLVKGPHKRYTHLLTNTMGPGELWAVSTTTQDRVLRDRLYDRLGPVAARRVLASKYPSGSAMADIERRKEALHRDAEQGDVVNVAEDIYRELLAAAERLGDEAQDAG